MRRILALLCLAILFTSSAWATRAFEPGSTTLVSQAANNDQLNSGGKEADISAEDIFVHVPVPGDFFYTYLPITRR